MKRCLVCAEDVEKNEQYHSKCLNELFGGSRRPELDINYEELHELAKKSVYRRVTVPGVQTKLSLEIERRANSADKLIIAGLCGRFILKPPSSQWPELPANEHCTMLLADAAGLEIVPNGLIHLASGELAYITKRIDRDVEGHKFAMEDMCQLTGRLTEDKNKGSHEQIGKIVKQFSTNPIFDLTRLYEMVLFCYVTGNADMHLKNFSMYKDPKVGWKLAPGYDLLNTRLVIPPEKDPDELALTLSGKKSNFSAETFYTFGISIGLNKKQIQNILDRLFAKQSILIDTIDKSFLSQKMKQSYIDIIRKRFEVIR